MERAVVVWALGLPVAELTDCDDDPPQDASAIAERTAATQIRGAGMWCCSGIRGSGPPYCGAGVVADLVGTVGEGDQVEVGGRDLSFGLHGVAKPRPQR